MRILFVLLASALLAAGCSSARLTRRQAASARAPLAPLLATTPAAGPDPSLRQVPDTPYRLGPGDVLDVELLGDIRLRARTPVGPDGRIYFYLLPGLDVRGLTLAEVRRRISAGLGEHLREPPPVSVTLQTAASQRVWLLGRVQQPGSYPLAGPTTLREALAAAGGPATTTLATRRGPAEGNGPEESADLGRAFVLRDGRRLPVDFVRLLHEGDANHDIYLREGDLVYLPAVGTGQVHVLGAVNSPRTIEFSSQLTLVEAVTRAGGPLVRGAHAAQVAVVRGSLQQPRIGVFDLGAILRGQSADVALEPTDIVFVPDSPHLVGMRYLDLILDTFARVVGINEGARAVSDRAVSAGVTVPLGP